MAKTRLVLHMGMPKTGTSLLQNALINLMNATDEMPLIYPRYGRGQNVAHHALVREILETPIPDVEHIATRLSLEIEAECTRNPTLKVAACSSESFANLCGFPAIPKLKAFFDAFPDTVFVQGYLVLRELSDFLESMFMQSTRFGHQTAAFPDYIESRQKWAVDLFDGLDALKSTLGSRFQVDAFGRDFDVISDFAARTGIPLEPLQHAAGQVPSTAKRPLKQQVAMTHITKLEQALGFNVERRRLIGLFNSDFSFDEDVPRFTLYDEHSLAAVAKLLDRVASTRGYAPYADALGAPRERKDVPVYSLDFAHLQPNDFAALAKHRQTLSA